MNHLKKLTAFLAAVMLLAVCGAAFAEKPGGLITEWTDARCEEDAFTTRIPAQAPSEYRNATGQVGLTVYLKQKGSVPCIIIHRRAADKKFKNPTDYLNNVYREFLENRYEENGGSVGTNPAKIWNVGGKELLGARYFIQIGTTKVTQLQLIEIREQGDVEYSAMYRDEEEEKLTMEALNAAAENYAEE